MQGKELLGAACAKGGHWPDPWGVREKPPPPGCWGVREKRPPPALELLNAMQTTPNLSAQETVQNTHMRPLIAAEPSRGFRDAQVFAAEMLHLLLSINFVL